MAEDRETEPDARARADFVEKALGAAGEWARFADPKLFGVLAFLGLGVANLLTHAHPLWEAHNEDTAWGWVATVAFVIAAVLAVLTVLFATLGLFPRLRARHGAASLYYFGGIASFNTPREYEAAVQAKTAHQLVAELTNQAWEVACIAKKKHAWARRAYFAVVAFLAAWVVARLGLAFIN